MKKYFLFILISLICTAAQAQPHHCTGIETGIGLLASDLCTFEDSCVLIFADTVQGNLWQRGTPLKGSFTSAWSLPKAMVTDTLNPYPQGNLSSFEVVIPLVNTLYFMNTTVSFRHRMNTDTLRDGGYIQVRYHPDSAWRNIACDTVPYSFYTYFNCENLYGIGDTLYNGEPGFSGNTAWVHTQLQWVWMLPVKDLNFPDTLRLRFSFISDSAGSSGDGWMIDDLTLAAYDFGGGIAEQANGGTLQISPLPATDMVNISRSGFPGVDYMLSVYNLQGKLVQSQHGIPQCGYTLQRGTLPAGIYFAVITGTDGSVMRGKIVFR